MGFSLHSPGQGVRLGGDESMSLWRLEGGRWALPIVSRTMDRKPLPEHAKPLAPGEPWEVELAAKTRGVVELSMLWFATMEDSGRQRRGQLMVDLPSGRRQVEEVEAGVIRVKVPVEPGRHVVRLTLIPETTPGGAAGLFPLGTIDFSFIPGSD